MIRISSTTVPTFRSHSVSIEWLVLIYFIVSLGISITLRASTAAVDGFFAELGNVSASLASGQGISNVFGDNSGPTAWCPVLNVLTYAAIFKIFGVKTVAAFWALIVLRCTLFSIALWWLLKLDYASQYDTYKIWLLPIFLGYTTLVIFRTGPKDSMFSIFLSVWTIYTLVGCWRQGIESQQKSLFLLAFLLPWSSISLAIGLVLFLVGLFLFNRKNLITLVSIFGLVVLSFSVWGMRNSNSLGKFIPYKSNLWFEMYISNVVDEDGILKYSNYRKYHPYTNKEVAAVYKEKGEVPFLKEYQEASINYLQEQPLDFFGKILNRCVNIVVFAKSEKDVELAAVEKFSTEDEVSLTEARLVVDNYWVCLEWPENEFQQKLTQLQLSETELILADWQKKSKISQERVNNIDDPNELIKGILTSIIPTLAIILGLFIPGIRNNEVFLIALFLFLLSIGPYLVISWTPRYQSFQLGFFTIFVFLILAQLLPYFRMKYFR